MPARSRNQRPHGNASIRCLRIVLDLPVAANNTKVFSVAYECQQWFHLHCCRTAKYSSLRKV